MVAPSISMIVSPGRIPAFHAGLPAVCSQESGQILRPRSVKRGPTALVRCIDIRTTSDEKLGDLLAPGH